MDIPERCSLSLMPPRHILSPQSRAALFDPPTDPAAIVRHYTFSSEDLALIHERRRAANRLGFGRSSRLFEISGSSYWS